MSEAIQRWDSNLRKFIPSPKNIEDFLDEIEALCKKHNLCISHEDEHGAFLIDKYNPDDIEWLRCAHIDYRNND